MNDLLPGARRWWVPALAAVLVLGTYLLLCRHAYPANDDWFYAADGRDRGVLPSLASYWQGTGGRWLAALLLYALGWTGDLPAAYPLLAVLNLGLLLAGGAVLAHLAGVRGRPSLALATVLIGACQIVALPVLSIGNLAPHSAVPEVIYWMSGSWTYALAYPLLALAWWATTGTSRISLAGLVLIGVAVTGLSETAAILAGASAVLLGLCGHRRGWVLAGVVIAGFAVSALSPGNLHRMEMLRKEVNPEAGTSSLAAACLAGVLFTVRHLLDWLLNPLVAALLGVAAWLGARSPAGSRTGLHRIALVLVLTIAGVWAAAVPSLALVGFLEGRQEGIISLLAVSGLLAAAWLTGRWAVGGAGRPWRELAFAAWVVLAGATLFTTALPLAVPVWAAAVLCGLLLVAAGWTVLRWQAGLPFLVAAALLCQPAWWLAVADVRGAAPALSQAQVRRDRAVRIITAAGHRSVAIPHLGVPERMPRTICLYEVQPGWMADGYARYFGLSDAVVTDQTVEVVPVRRVDGGWAAVPLADLFSGTPAGAGR